MINIDSTTRPPNAELLSDVLEQSNSDDYAGYYRLVKSTTDPTPRPNTAVIVDKAGDAVLLSPCYVHTDIDPEEIAVVKVSDEVSISPKF